MKTTLSFVGLAATFLLALALPIFASTGPSPTPGKLWGWGPNYIGQVGDCTQTCRPEPVELSELGEFVAADAGALFTLALKADGTVWGWGHNIYGQLGDGTNINRICPVQVAGLQDVKAIATGDCFSIALKRDGTVWAWGHNQTLQAGLCDWLTLSVTAPVQVEGVSDVIAIDAGSQHGVALKSDGSVWCWGIGLFGVLGQGDFDYHTSCVALQVLNVSGAIAIATGGHFTLCLLSDGTIKGWGKGEHGQLGLDSSGSRALATHISGVSEVVAIATGSAHSLALRSDGTVWGWGANDSGQLGVGLSAVGVGHPVLIEGFEHVAAIGAGRIASLSFLQIEDGSLWLLGEAGFCGASPPPVTLLSLPVARTFSSATAHIMVLEGPPRLRPPGLGSMRKRTHPYRIEAIGFGLQPGYQVFLDEDETPWAKVRIDSPTQFTLKGGDKLKARVKSKTPFPFRIVNPDGGQVRVLWGFKK